LCFYVNNVSFQTLKILFQVENTLLKFGIGNSFQVLLEIDFSVEIWYCNNLEILSLKALFPNCGEPSAKATNRNVCYTILIQIKSTYQ
jgi:hypothetical protein